MQPEQGRIPREGRGDTGARRQGRDTGWVTHGLERVRAWNKGEILLTQLYPGLLRISLPVNNAWEDVVISLPVLGDFPLEGQD